MDDIRHIRFQVPRAIFRLLFLNCCLTQYRFPVSPVAGSSKMLDPVKKHLIVTRLQHIIISSQAERIFCNPFLPHCRDNNKRRLFFYCHIMTAVLHNCQAVHFRHNNIQHHHIRFLFFDDITDFFSVMCFADQCQILVLFDHPPQYFYHLLVIICYCYI